MNAPRPITGRTVLIGFIAFFGVIFAVNGVFVYFALDSWPGLRFEKAYERGLNYNRVLSDADKQAELKWKSAVNIEPNGSGNHLVSVHLTEAAGNPITGKRVLINLSRPTHAGSDTALEMKASAPGRYEAIHRFSAAGRWHAAVSAQGNDGETYKMIHDIIIEP